MSNRRPRRSRIYDLNYNIGENYYKSAIDRLDEKDSRTSRLTRFSEPPVSSPPKSRFLTQLSTDGALDEDTLDFARDRASKVIQRETILDQRTGRKALELESDFDSQVSATRKIFPFIFHCKKKMFSTTTWHRRIPRRCSVTSELYF